MNGSVLEERFYFKMLGLTFLSKLDWASYINSIAKTVSKMIGALVRSMNFLSPKMQPYVGHYCHVWAIGPSCYLELLDKLKKRICRTVSPSIATSNPWLIYEM